MHYNYRKAWIPRIYNPASIYKHFMLITSYCLRSSSRRMDAAFVAGLNNLIAIFHFEECANKFECYCSNQTIYTNGQGQKVSCSIYL